MKGSSDVASTKTTSGLTPSSGNGSISVTGNSAVISNPAGDGLLAVSGASGTILTSNGASAPSFQTVAAVVGVLPVVNGGTGVSTKTGTGSVVLNAAPTINNAAIVSASLQTSTEIPYVNANQLLLTDGSKNITSVGTVLTGRALLSNLSGTAPSFQQIDISTGTITGVLPVANGGTGLTAKTAATQTFLLSGSSYTTPAGCTFIDVTVIGAGGGGGGGCTNFAAFPGVAGSGGGGGGSVQAILPPGTYAYSVGAGGAGGAGSLLGAGISGSAGTTTTFGAGLISVASGAGGQGGQSAADQTGGTGGAIILAPANAFLCNGNSGGVGYLNMGGHGGSSALGGGGATSITSFSGGVPGSAGSAYGGGGGGGTYGQAGGSGFQGCIRITEYYN